MGSTVATTSRTAPANGTPPTNASEPLYQTSDEERTSPPSLEAQPTAQSPAILRPTAQSPRTGSAPVEEVRTLDMTVAPRTKCLDDWDVSLPWTKFRPPSIETTSSGTFSPAISRSRGHFCPRDRSCKPAPGQVEGFNNRLTAFRLDPTA